MKLENILLDEALNIKIADYGFATFKHIKKLKSYKGTKTYMAPEIKEGKIYDGRQADMFSTGVIIWIIVVGSFPFLEATPDDYFYKELLNENNDNYWKKTET